MFRRVEKVAVALFSLLLSIAGIALFWQLNTVRQGILLATTTSLYDSGLLSSILPDFEQQYRAEVHVLALGTGQALEYGKRGDADVLLVHAPELEREFMESGCGAERRELFYNYFVLVGPKTNPAGISNENNITQAFWKIYNSGSNFVSRGDGSGTHFRELEIWRQLGISLSDLKARPWYLNGSGSMSTALLVANEKEAYALSDIATWAFLHQKLGNLRRFEIQKSEELLNVYSLILTKAGMERNSLLLQKFKAWFESAETLSKIENYTVNSEQLFKVRW
ncbi:MAG: substrate-binding domain-containing protein [Thermoplasmata archaeon]